MEKDPINPSYYRRGKIPVHTFIIDQGLDSDEASIVKYMCRHKYRGGVLDLQKARWYLNKLIRRYKKELKDADRKTDPAEV